MTDCKQPIDTAPKDGTVVWGRNKLMDRAVHMKFGTYNAWGKDYPNNWIVVQDFDRFMPVRPGTLIVPDFWEPISEDEK